ncbi:uncharacterized protein LOC115633017 [Scaptodrosophila lebanonensis]|uniref:Uncharacterized protein LOC115633017 n=1 Tax=Drosophila lebanonensis TaxID=7225 RepID=A0A6J2UDH5_DROLE|nr:uncharacterized protein LOC115633017 [Scaptodrosophila lebanonensis]
MPVLQAPAEYLESSPDQSLQPEWQPIPLVLAPPGPAALAQVQARPPEGRLNLGRQQQPQPQPQPTTRNNRRALLRNNSFDRDLALNEESQHLPAFVHLLPVVLPVQGPEPTLDELLRRVTQRNDLENVETVRLRVISYTLSLSRLSLFLPRLQQLDLSGSVLSSLRDLGYGLLHLTQLNVSNCGLNSFDGTSGLPAIRTLIADGNMIQRVGPLSELSQLQRLSARNNRISELGLLSFLGMCPQLMDVELRGNPVCRLPLYRATLRRSVPTLTQLDGQPLDMNSPTNVVSNESPPAATNETEEESSLSSDLSSDMESIGRYRPATASHHSDSGATENLRPSSAAVLVSLSAGVHRQASTTTTPVAGSVLGLVRQRRRRSGLAWVSSSSSSSSYASMGSTHAPSISSCSSNSSLDAHSTAYTFNARGTFD